MIEQSLALQAERMSTAEEEAIEIVWRNRGEGSQLIPADEAIKILIEIRERVSKIERKALRAMLRSMNEGRRTPRRHQMIALIIVAGILGIVALLIALKSSLI